MKKSDFHFDLPEELIAQTPAARRGDSRLMLLPRLGGAVSHKHFSELPQLFSPGDCLVFNDSRVLPARLFGKLDSGGAVEVVLLRDVGGRVWECLTRPGRKFKPGTRVTFGGGEMIPRETVNRFAGTPELSPHETADRFAGIPELTAEVTGVTHGGNRLLRFDYNGLFLETLERLGKMPLPPYIREELEDAERYQTVYARETGSAAAPTAGLHFTREILAEIEARGVDIVYLTLHVGLGTFRPVKADDIEAHEMHAEYCEISAEAAARVNAAKARGGRVVAVGTTSCRTLESAAADDGQVAAFAGFTDIYIYPGYRFKCVDGLITNFHLPESTLIMLVSALAGRERVLAAYAEAARERYRFFSFGDCMAIV